MEPKDDKQATASPRDAAAATSRRTYQTPAVRRLGTVAELTLTGGTVLSTDGLQPNSKSG